MSPEHKKYIASIRNQAKRQYAEAWAKFCEGGPEPESYGLSYMGAQAVRMRLDALGLCPRDEQREEDEHIYNIMIGESLHDRR